VLPTVSSPNWASMLMGAEPDVHGIHDNDWQPSEKRFPTIFTALRDAKPKAVLAVAYEWLGFGRFFDHKEVTHCVSCLAEAVKKDAPPDANARYVISKASDLIKEQRPLLTWIHIDLVDHAGHGQGYDSEEYNKTVSVVDGFLGDILQAAEHAGIRQDTVFIIVSDHGGQGTGHGGISASETRVPWIISGKGIAAGVTLGQSVSVAQTAPTIARILGVTPPKVWTTQPVADILR
jgi:predicted AlkP superfamily pyrophosphatase or phosphodiesterase